MVIIRTMFPKVEISEIIFTELLLFVIIVSTSQSHCFPLRYITCLRGGILFR